MILTTTCVRDVRFLITGSPSLNTYFFRITQTIWEWFCSHYIHCFPNSLKNTDLCDKEDRTNIHLHLYFPTMSRVSDIKSDELIFKTTNEIHVMIFRLTFCENIFHFLAGSIFQILIYRKLYSYR